MGDEVGSIYQYSKPHVGKLLVLDKNKDNIISQIDKSVYHHNPYDSISQKNKYSGKSLFLRKIDMKESNKRKSNAVPRILQFSVNKIVLDRALLKYCGDDGYFEFVISLKMKTSRRSIKSRKIVVDLVKCMELHCDVLLTFAYWHSLRFCTGAHQLDVHLQQKNRYKKRRVFGYKTLASVSVSLDNLLQSGKLCTTLKLFSELKDTSISGPTDATDVVSEMYVKMSTKPYQKKFVKSNYVSLNQGMVSDDDYYAMVENFNINAMELDDGGEFVPSDISDSEIEIKNVSNRQRLKAKFSTFIKKIKNPSFLDSGGGNEYIMDMLNPSSSHNMELDDYMINMTLPSEDDEYVADSSLDSNVSNYNPIHLKPELKPYFSNMVLNNSENSLKSLLKKSTMSRSSLVKTQQPILPISRSNSLQTCKDLLPVDVRSLSYEIVVNKPFSSPLKQSESSGFANLENVELSKSMSVSTSKSMSKPPSSQKLCRRFTVNNGSMHLLKNYSRNSSLVSKFSSTMKFENQCEISPVNPLSKHTISNIRKSIRQMIQGPFPEKVFILFDTEKEVLTDFFIQRFNHYLVCKCFQHVDCFIESAFDVVESFTCKGHDKPTPFRILIVGQDAFVSRIMRCYVKYSQANKSFEDWNVYIRFLFLPTRVTSELGGYLASIDGVYNANFNDVLWKLCCSSDENVTKKEIVENESVILERIKSYVGCQGSNCFLQIAEVMFNDADSNHVFVPFLNKVKVGCENMIPDKNTTKNSVKSLSKTKITPTPKSETRRLSLSKKNEGESKKLFQRKSKNTLEASPLALKIDNTHKLKKNGVCFPVLNPREKNMIITNSSNKCDMNLVDLQVDYWMSTLSNISTTNDDKQTRKDHSKNKVSLKSCSFVNVKRLPQNGILPNLNIVSVNCFFVRKKKYNMINRISKKSGLKDSKARTDYISLNQDSVSRVICSSKAQDKPLLLNIDGHLWTAVSFFQMAAQWKGHTKYFPIIIYDYT